MSVDCTARVVYGFALTHEEYEKYQDKCHQNGTEVSDYCLWVNEYDEESDVLFCISIDSTGDYTTLDIPLMALSKETKNLLKEWRENFPERAHESPLFLLVSHWW